MHFLIYHCWRNSVFVGHATVKLHFQLSYASFPIKWHPFGLLDTGILYDMIIKFSNGQNLHNLHQFAYKNIMYNLINSHIKF